MDSIYTRYTYIVCRSDFNKFELWNGPNLIYKHIGFVTTFSDSGYRFNFV